MLASIRGTAYRARRWLSAPTPTGWRLRRGEGVVLLYHRVARPDLDPWRLAVSPEHFKEHMETISELFRPISLEQLAAGIEVGRVEPRSVAVTFDDGYRDNLYAAKPVLERLGVPATVFVTSAYIGAERDFWWEELAELCRKADQPTIDDRYYRIWAELRDLPEARRVDVLDGFWAEAGTTPPPIEFAPSTDELVRLAEGGLLVVGSHTRTHPWLPACDRESQLGEIRAGKEALEAVLGHRVDAFAYPYGAYDRVSVECVRSADVRRACIIGRRPVTHGVSPFEIPRIPVADVPGSDLARLLERVFHD